MPNPREPFEPDTTYHVFQHGNGNENIFREYENYRFFLERVEQYILPITRMYAYCLMPNHFHFLLRIRTEEELIAFFLETKKIRNVSEDIADLDLDLT